LLVLVGLNVLWAVDSEINFVWLLAGFEDLVLAEAGIVIFDFYVGIV